MIIEATTSVAVVIGLTQAIKNLGLPIKYVPTVAVFLGIVCSLVVGGEHWPMLVFNGIIFGLTACGLYSGTKTTTTAQDITDI